MLYKTSSFYYYTKYHFSILTNSICNLNFVHFILEHWFHKTHVWASFCVCDCTVESLRLSLQPDFNLSVQAVIRGRNILHWYVHGEMREALLDDCLSAFGVEGASKGFVLRCVFETFHIEPVDPLIACVARGFLFSLFCFFQGLMKITAAKPRSGGWRNYVFFTAQAPRGL